MREALTLPVLRVEFTLASGEVLERDWTMSEDVPDIREPPSWLVDTARSWDRPQDPVTLRGTVLAGHEDEAREFVGTAA